MKKVISLLTAFVIVLSCTLCTPFAAKKKPSKLRFDKEGKFTILHITDPQDDQNPARELKKFINEAIKSSKPDLVVFTGDFVEDSRRSDIGTDAKSFQEGVVVNGDYNKTLENVKVAVDAVFFSA